MFLTLFNNVLTLTLYNVLMKLLKNALVNLTIHLKATHVCQFMIFHYVHRSPEQNCCLFQSLCCSAGKTYLCAKLLSMIQIAPSLTNSNLSSKSAFLPLTLPPQFQSFKATTIHLLLIVTVDNQGWWSVRRLGVNACWDPLGKCFGLTSVLIYVNSLLSQVTDGVLLQYDTSLVCSGTSPLAAAEVMNQQLQLVYNWIVSNKMQMNFQKS